MARQPRYEDYVSYDPEPVEEAEDEVVDPITGRLWADIYAERTARHRETYARLMAEAEATRAKAALTVNFASAAA